MSSSGHLYPEAETFSCPPGWCSFWLPGPHVVQFLHFIVTIFIFQVIMTLWWDSERPRKYHTPHPICPRIGTSDDGCPTRSSLGQLKLDFPTPALPPALPVGLWRSTGSKSPPVSPIYLSSYIIDMDFKDSYFFKWSTLLSLIIFMLKLS